MHPATLEHTLKSAREALTEWVFGDPKHGTELTLTAVQNIDDALRALAQERGIEACPTCGKPVVQPETGRPRIYCRDACRKAAQRARRTAQGSW